MTSFSVLKEYSANKLKYFREKNNMTQEELAEELTKRKLKREEELYNNKKIDKIDDTPITRQTVSKYENATIGMNQDILFDIASIFEKSINDFFPPLEQYLSDSNEDNINKTIFNKDGVKITVAHNGELNDKMLLEINNLLLNEKILKEELKKSDARNAEK